MLLYTITNQVSITFHEAVNFFEECLKSIGPGSYENVVVVVPPKNRSTWFLSPRQHVLEFLVYSLLFIPLAFLCARKAKIHPSWKNHPEIPCPNLLDILMGVLTTISYILTLYYKFSCPAAWRLPYVLQPCHTLTLLLTFTAFSSSKISNVIFQIYVSLTWSSVLAFLFPDMSDYEHWGDVFNYYYEHLLMLIVPYVFVKTGRFQLIRSKSWVILGYTLMAIYHFVILQFAAFVLGVNIATLMSPPQPLEWLGMYYRPVQYAFCFVLHIIHNLILQSWLGTNAENLSQDEKKHK